MTTSKLMITALEYAAIKHKGQHRKITGEAYIIHPVVVREICSWFTDDVDVLVAAILHDVVEDTDGTLEEIAEMFNDSVAEIVKYTTEVSGDSKKPRKVRKAMDRKHYNKGCDGSKIIKVADAITNCSSIAKLDNDFSVLYLGEKELMVKEFLKAENISKGLNDISNEFLDMLENWKTNGIFETVDGVL